MAKRKETERDRNESALKAMTRKLLSAKPKRAQRENVQRLTAGLWARPFKSEALGVTPEQIPEATRALRAAGVTADFAPDGSLIVTSDKQYRDAARACGLFTGRDGYGGGQDQDGRRVRTGRETERAKEEFRRRVAAGEFDL